jgi:hypothetical protein
MPTSPAVTSVRLERDHWEDGRPSRLTVDTPTPSDVAAAVRALDQRHHTEIVVTGHDGQYLAVSGGAGRYVVHLGSDEHDDAIVVLAADAPSGQEPMVMGGRTRVVPRSRVVDLESALRAVRSFVADGRPDPSLRWATSLGD